MKNQNVYLQFTSRTRIMLSKDTLDLSEENFSLVFDLRDIIVR